MSRADAAARWLAEHDPAQDGVVSVTWRRGKVRLWLPARRLYGGRDGHAEVLLPPAAALQVAQDIRRLLDKHQRDKGQA